MFRRGSKNAEHERDHVPKKGLQWEHGIKTSEHDENGAKKALAGAQATSNRGKSRDTIRGHARS